MVTMRGGGVANEGVLLCRKDLLPMVNHMNQNKYRAPIDKKRTNLSTKGPILGSYSMKALFLLKLEAVLYLMKIL